MRVVAWFLLGPPAAQAVTIADGRLLDARRGWVALAVAGLIGWTGGVPAAGELTGWARDSIDVALVAVVLGTLFTMATAVLIDLVAPVGSLAPGDEAGLCDELRSSAAPQPRSSADPAPASVMEPHITTELGEAVSMNEVLGYFNIAAASALALRVVAGIIRDGET